jgi:hypothetical protein
LGLTNGWRPPQGAAQPSRSAANLTAVATLKTDGGFKLIPKEAI